eukprot:Hpha_TRINITY_DN3227_c0_g1::TRINITY_DN3227_c0_g1_i1::g.186059::m.186059
MPRLDDGVASDVASGVSGVSEASSVRGKAAMFEEIARKRDMESKQEFFVRQFVSQQKESARQRKRQKAAQERVEAVLRAWIKRVRARKELQRLKAKKEAAEANELKRRAEEEKERADLERRLRSEAETAAKDQASKLVDAEREKLEQQKVELLADIHERQRQREAEAEELRKELEEAELVKLEAERSMKNAQEEAEQHLRWRKEIEEAQMKDRVSGWCGPCEIGCCIC